MSHTNLKRIGMSAWAFVVLSALCLLWRLPGGSLPATSQAVSTSLSTSLVHRTDHFDARDLTGSLRPGDSIFTQMPSTQRRSRQTPNAKKTSANTATEWTQLGYVSTANNGDLAITWHDGIPPSGYQFVVHRQSGSLQNVVATMLPPEKQRLIRNRIEAAMNQHGDEIAAALSPLIRQSLERSLPVIESSFRDSVDRHQSEIDDLARSWNNEIVQQRLVPMARDEILPIVRTHAQPEVEAIGRELWEKASLWRFGWRAFYDKTPLPKQDLLREEWERFVEEEAIPIFESHTDELVVAVQRTLRDTAANPKVQAELREVAVQVGNDPAAQRLVTTILRETFIDSPALRDVWKQVWTSTEAQESLRVAGDRIEPVIRKIGDDLFGSRETGIDPNFARVLRSQILGKDRRWIEAIAKDPIERSDSPTIEMSAANKPMAFPLVYLADRNSNGD